MTVYIALLRKEPKSDFGVDFPDFPGCVSAGSTTEEAARMAREALELHIEGMLEDGGYFAAVEEAYFVDSGLYPETHDDGIARKSDGGVAAGSIVPRLAPPTPAR